MENCAVTKSLPNFCRAQSWRALQNLLIFVRFAARLVHQQAEAWASSDTKLASIALLDRGLQQSGLPQNALMMVIRDSLVASQVNHS